MKFRNPANGYEEEVGPAGLWCLLFGFIYFAAKGVWTHAIASLVLAFCTAGASWLVYPFFAREAVEKNYLRKGWIPVQVRILHLEAEPAEAKPPAGRRLLLSVIAAAIAAGILVMAWDSYKKPAPTAGALSLPEKRPPGLAR